MAQRNVDELRLWLGDPIVINQHVVIHQPTIREIVEYGEHNYWGLVSTLTAIPSDMKSILFDIGVDFEAISDFELFAMLVSVLPASQSHILLGDLDLSKFKLCNSPDNGELVMYDAEHDITIDWNVHRMLADAICKAHGIVKKPEKAFNARTKQILIDLDREDRERDLNKPVQSQIRSMMSAMICYPGFPYTHQTIQSLTPYQLIDSVNRAQIYTSTIALLNGSYSGFCDMSKIDKSKFDWLREVPQAL